MDRITQKDLEIKVKELNIALSRPLEPWTRTANGGWANIGNFHLYYAYGSVGVHEMATGGGGVRELFGLGTKRDTYNKLCDYLSGITAGRR